MATKQIRGIAVPRHDTAINWAKAINFTPQKGEIIIYDADAAGTVYPSFLTINGAEYAVSDLGRDITPSTTIRIKVGDGSTKVSYLPYLLGTAGENGSDEELSQIELDTIEAKARGIEPVNVKIGAAHDSNGFLGVSIQAATCFVDWIRENGILLVATQDGSVFSGTCNYMSGDAYTTVPAVTVNNGDFIFLSPDMVNSFDLANDINNGIVDFGFQGSGGFDIYVSNYNSELDKFFKVIGSNEYTDDGDYYTFSLSFYIDNPDQLFYIYNSYNNFDHLYDDNYVTDSDGNMSSISTFIHPTTESTLNSYYITDIAADLPNPIYPVSVSCQGYNLSMFDDTPGPIDVFAEYTPELPDSDTSDNKANKIDTYAEAVIGTNDDYFQIPEKSLQSGIIIKTDPNSGSDNDETIYGIRACEKVFYDNWVYEERETYTFSPSLSATSDGINICLTDWDYWGSEYYYQLYRICDNDVIIYGMVESKMDLVDVYEYAKTKIDYPTSQNFTKSNAVPLTITYVDDETGEESTVTYQLVSVE